MTNKVIAGDIIIIGPSDRAYVPLPFSGVSEKYRTRDVTIKDYAEYVGAYIVTDAKMAGGGKGHSDHDVYPDGWNVSCFKIDEPEKRISFYQSGSFTAVNSFVPVVGRAKSVTSWELDDDTFSKVNQILSHTGASVAAQIIMMASTSSKGASVKDALFEVNKMNGSGTAPTPR